MTVVSVGATPVPAARPVVELARVYARDAAGIEGRARGSLAGVSLSLGAGIHAFLGAPEDGTLALAELLGGARGPLKGRVTVAGRNPASTPFLRARVGALAAEPRLPAASTVRAAVRLAMRARGETGERFDAVIDPLGLSPLQARDPRSLSFAEQRAIELAIALSTPAPLLLVLHEPLADVAMPRLDLIPLRLREAAGSGCCVVLTTSSPADARALADHVVVLHKGLVAREALGGRGIVLDEGITLRAWVHLAGQARELCAALALRPEVSAVSFRDGPPGEATLVTVTGDHAEPCALAVIEAALETGAEIDALTEEAPSLGDVRAATEALWRTMQTRQPPAPPPVRPPAAPPASAPEPERLATPPPAPVTMEETPQPPAQAVEAPPDPEPVQGGDP
jgi:ABC-2 type transport system ATP-binding protein